MPVLPCWMMKQSESSFIGTEWLSGENLISLYHLSRLQSVTFASSKMNELMMTSILNKRADGHIPSDHVESRLPLTLRPSPFALDSPYSKPTDLIFSSFKARTMQEVPIVIEASGPESYAEFSMTAETLVTADVDNPEEDLSILARDASMPVAIVGMGFRGPGEATNVNKLWETILEQREAWSSIPAKRWNNKAFYHPDHGRHGTINVEGGHFIEEDVSLFDAPFFNMTSDEAAVCVAWNEADTVTDMSTGDGPPTETVARGHVRGPGEW